MEQPNSVKTTFITVTSFSLLSFSRERRKAVNQTEIIYSVFANDKPVLAVTAAEDMKLVSDIEVETILDKDVIMKAERKICWFLFLVGRYIFLFPSVPSLPERASCHTIGTRGCEWSQRGCSCSYREESYTCGC